MRGHFDWVGAGIWFACFIAALLISYVLHVWVER